MTTPRQRIGGIEARLRDRTPDEPPTRAFFARDRACAAAGAGGQDAAATLAAVEHIDRAIREYDAIRRAHRLDLIDVAILVRRGWYGDHGQHATAIAMLLVEAFWNWDVERFGEDRAWSQQRSRAAFEPAIAARLRQHLTGTDRNGHRPTRYVAR